MALFSTQNYQNWLMNVEDIASQSPVVIVTVYGVTEKTMSRVHVSTGSAETGEVG